MICSGCKREQENTQFSWRNKAKEVRQDYCKSCKRLYNKAWYESHKTEQIARAEARRLRHKDLVHKILDEIKAVPCADCGNRFPPVAMDFDHVGKDKNFTISVKVAHGMALDLLLAEVAKCEVVCACCHRVRTAIRLGLVDRAQLSEG